MGTILAHVRLLQPRAVGELRAVYPSRPERDYLWEHVTCYPLRDVGSLKLYVEWSG